MAVNNKLKWDFSEEERSEKASGRESAEWVQRILL